MILGIGTDVVLTKRFGEIFRKNPQRLARMCQRILHRDEQPERYVASAQVVQKIASAWAAKEALYKSLDRSEQPNCIFNRWKKVRNNGRYEMVSDDPRPDQVLVSISHDGDYTIAMVVRQSASS